LIVIQLIKKSPILLNLGVHHHVPQKLIILLVLYGHEILFLSQREEYRLMVFEDKFLRKILEPDKGEVTGRWGSM
jgi:hypothetical protein